MQREIHSLIFELQTEPPASRYIVVPLDGGRYRANARPARSGKAWLDVRRGDRIIMRGKWETVVEVRPYRALPILDGYPAISCGRDWLEGCADRRPHWLFKIG